MIAERIIIPMKINDNKKDWNSYEIMLRDDGLYDRGLVINHNMNPSLVKYGSAIFMHIWPSEMFSTAGCTAMSKKNMRV